MADADAPIPGRLNLLLLAVAGGASAGLLWIASHADAAWQIAGAALVFSFTANTLFSLLHEAVHGVFHDRRAVNEWGGRLAAAFFPTGLSIQRAFHLTHHRNNRSEYEQFDYVHEGDVKWLKYAQWYAILTGVYWAVSVVGVVAYLFVPRALRARKLRDKDSQAATQTASAIYMAALDELPPIKSRLEILGSLAVQAAMFVALDLSPTGWLACYAAFGLNWSSLQYADHAFSPLNQRDGAWNLKVNAVFRAFFLNYHYHLAHHRHPGTPWLHLARHIDPDEPMPSYLSIWLKMWAGPRPYPGDPAP